jgi:two-component system response regulator PilR (NtrC family)
MEGKILVIDDEAGIREVIRTFFESQGYKVKVASKYKDIDNAKDVGVVVCDVRLPDVDGIEIIPELKNRFKGAEIIMITAYEKDAGSAVKALKLGAFDYLTKPFKLDELFLMVEKALEKVRLREENKKLRLEVLKHKKGLGLLVGTSEPMLELYEKIEKVAPTDVSVLIVGESGAGKELTAKTIHTLSKREGKIIVVNCASIPENLLESELFGHEKGAFTGAAKVKKGLIEEADRGTLFLDEIGDMPLSLQSKLLRFLESGELRRIGSNLVKNIDVRVIAATNKDLKTLIEEKRFREDLFYRLSTFNIELPSLRCRKEDIPILARHILREISDNAKIDYSLSSGTLKALLLYDYPGNVRELSNILNQAAVMSNGTIVYENLPDYLREEKVRGKDLEEKSAAFEKNLILEALKTTGGAKIKTAEILGISLRSLRYKLKKYNLS